MNDLLMWVTIGAALLAVLMASSWWNYNQGIKDGYRRGYDDGDQRRDYRP